MKTYKHMTGWKEEFSSHQRQVEHKHLPVSQGLKTDLLTPRTQWQHIKVL